MNRGSFRARPTLAGVRDLADRYDVFLVDQFGVLHDGWRPYPGAVEVLTRLCERRMKVVLLSNSGRRVQFSRDRLAALGIAPQLYDEFLTAGECAHRILSERWMGAACHLVGAEWSEGPTAGLDLTPVRRPDEADIIVISGIGPSRLTRANYRQILAPAAELAIPCLCANPDRIVLRDGNLCFGPGAIADDYAAMGGQVDWVGKPQGEFHAAALASVAGNGAHCVAVGDNPDTDAAGARNAGLKAALVMSGVWAGEPNEHVKDAHILASFSW